MIERKQVEDSVNQKHIDLGLPWMSELLGLPDRHLTAQHQIAENTLALETRRSGN